MPENPHASILNRSEPMAHAEQHLAAQTALFRDLANYGSNLVLRAYESSPKKMADIVVCGVLLKQVVTMVDATEVLVTAGCVQAAFLPARAAFEASIYADYILQSDGERRAMRYIVSNYRSERLWAQRVIPGTAEEAAYRALPASLGIDFQALHPTLAADAAKHLSEVDRILSQPDFQSIDADFTQVKGRRKRDPDWYTLDGLSSIRQVAESVGRVAEYECFYSKGSQVTHSGSYKDQVLFTAGHLRLKPVRRLDGFNELLNAIVTTCIATYKSVLQQYRPGEMEAFGKKYLADWQGPFMNAPDLKYDYAPKGAALQ